MTMTVDVKLWRGEDVSECVSVTIFVLLCECV